MRVRVFLLLALLFGVSVNVVVLAQAVPKVAFPRTTSGNVTTFGPMTADAANAARFSFGAAANGAIFSNAPDSVPTAGGKSIPISGTATAGRASAGMALSKFAFRMAAPIQMGMAIYDLLNDLDVVPTWDDATKRNQFNVRQEGSGTLSGFQIHSGPHLCAAFGVCEPLPNPPLQPVLYPTKPPGTYLTDSAACIAGIQALGFGTTYQMIGSSPVGCQFFNIPQQDGGSRYQTLFKPVRWESTSVEDVPLTSEQLADKIAQASGWPTAASRMDGLVREALQSGGQIEFDPPVVTGPASLPAETQPPVVSERVESETTADGVRTRIIERTETTPTTQTKVEYDGNKMTQTQTRTQQQTKQRLQETTPVDANGNPTGAPVTVPLTGKVPSESTSETAPVEVKDPCEGNPDRLACAELGKPGDGEIPKVTKTLTFQAQNLGFGAGQCPPPFAWSDSLGAHQINLAPYCAMVSDVVRPLVLAFTALACLMMLAGVRTED